MPKTPPIRITQITDTHLFDDPAKKLLGLNTQDSFNAVLKTAAASGHTATDLLLLTGDLSQDDSPESYQRLAKSLGIFACPIHWVPGNHDIEPLMTKIFADSNISYEKAVIIGNWQIILLNTQIPKKVPGYLNPQELERLAQRLQQYPKHHTLICLHHHPVPLGSAWLDKLSLQNAPEFWEIINANPQVRCLLWGHVHQEYHAQHADLTLLSTPSTCLQFKPNSQEFTLDTLAPGYRWLELYLDGQLKTGVIRADLFTTQPDKKASGY